MTGQLLQANAAPDAGGPGASDQAVPYDPRDLEPLAFTPVEPQMIHALFNGGNAVDPDMAALLSGSGLSYSVAAALLVASLGYGEETEAANGGIPTCKGRVIWPNSEGLHLIWNRMDIYVNDAVSSAHFNIAAEKTLETAAGPCKVRFEWRLSVAPGGLRSAYVPNPSMPDLHYKFYARGDAITVEEFAVNGVTVPFFNPDTGALEPLAKIYSPAADDCIDINSKVDLSQGGTFRGRKGDLVFCAGSCSGYLLSATGE